MSEWKAKHDNWTGDPVIDDIIRRHLRYGQTRWAEVWFACIMVMFGVILLLEGESFNSRGYTIIREYVYENQAAWIAIIVGTARLVALWVNGRYSKSPIIRTLGCMGGFMFYSAITFGLYLAAPPFSTGIAVYGVLAIAELHASSRSAADVHSQDSLGFRDRARKRRAEGERAATVG